MAPAHVAQVSYANIWSSQPPFFSFCGTAWLSGLIFSATRKLMEEMLFCATFKNKWKEIKWTDITMASEVRVLDLKKAMGFCQTQGAKSCFLRHQQAPSSTLRRTKALFSAWHHETTHISPSIVSTRLSPLTHPCTVYVWTTCGDPSWRGLVSHAKSKLWQKLQYPKS